mgnify:FL=1|tara:strand:- start:1578 stop:2279 length:702 start_codon:yes stop_codon:yes gene_type:complete
MNWSKEEIMAYADGQLSTVDMIRVENIINENEDANNFYEKMVLSNDLINLSYAKLENSYKISQESSLAKQPEIKDKNKNLFGFGSLAISNKNILVFAFGAFILIAGLYQLGSQKKTSTMDDDYFKVIAMNTLIENQENISMLMVKGDRSEGIVMTNSEIGEISLILESVRFKNKVIRYPDEVSKINKLNINGLCNDISIKMKDTSYKIEACKRDNKWALKYKEAIKLNLQLLN